ncbi:MAG: sortase [Herpetosiphon sp.]
MALFPQLKHDRSSSGDGAVHVASRAIREKRRPEQLTMRGRWLWTIGNLLMLVGIYLLIFVGGLLADERFNVWAASGDSNISLPVPAAVAPVAPATSDMAAQASQDGAQVVASATARPATQDSEERPRHRLQLNDPGQGRELNSLVPVQEGAERPNTISRIVIPSIAVDRKVQEVAWHLESQNGVQVAIWDVAKYTVGHHKNTANPGDPGNIVLAGHSGGQAYPFNDLYYVNAGEKFTLWSNGRPYSYTVSERVILDESTPGVTEEQRRANARYIEPTSNEVVTLVTCWPLSGPLRFTQRVVVRATPDEAGSSGALPAETATPTADIGRADGAATKPATLTNGVATASSTATEQGAEPKTP